MVTVIFTLFFIDFFDTAGTLTSVANVAGKIGSDGKIKDIDKAMLSDSSIYCCWCHVRYINSYNLC